ncbi:hypothetical protein K9M47_00485 [Candidatus Gracilibacteria bacterium]|nr:hypothetical protein [Candidatus Gracilibacteria bacterium]
MSTLKKHAIFIVLMATISTHVFSATIGSGSKKSPEPKTSSKVEAKVNGEWFKRRVKPNGDTHLNYGKIGGDNNLRNHAVFDKDRKLKYLRENGRVIADDSIKHGKNIVSKAKPFVDSALKNGRNFKPGPPMVIPVVPQLFNNNRMAPYSPYRSNQQY